MRREISILTGAGKGSSDRAAAASSTATIRAGTNQAAAGACSNEAVNATAPARPRVTASAPAPAPAPVPTPAPARPRVSASGSAPAPAGPRVSAPARPRVFAPAPGIVPVSPLAPALAPAPAPAPAIVSAQATASPTATSSLGLPRRTRQSAGLPIAVTLSLAIFAAAASAGCGDDSHAGADAAVDGDADTDASVEPWTFSCLEEQPEGTLCFRGQVRDILTDAPVELPPGSTMQWYAPSQPGGFPDTLAAEVPVQPDGRFIFREAPHEPTEYLRDPDQSEEQISYSHADLRLVTSLDGSIVPENKYGFVCPECFPLICEECTERTPVQSFYLIPDGAFEAWDANVDEMTVVPDCRNRNLMPGLLYKTEIVVIEYVFYTEYPEYPHMEPTPACRLWGYGLPSGDTHCAYALGVDRVSGFLSEPAGYSGVRILPVKTEPQPEGEIVCVGLNQEYCGGIPKYPRWTAIGSAAWDTTGPVIVSHTWDKNFGPYM